ncbi:hypothetical protein J3R73_004510 [Labrys monachus]|uniref:Uncharacterized protein n=1 Tax=Labrys monachus TaxID=217067 RepID=A0ABU0FJD3_9HYPH|nr:hypothetical protein [Labrys monachus]
MRPSRAALSGAAARVSAFTASPFAGNGATFIQGRVLNA